MRRSFVLIALFAAGCGSAPNVDTSKVDIDAARALVLKMNRNVEFLLVDGPEYAAIPKVTRGRSATLADKSAACGVRIRFREHDENRTVTDDWIVWVTGDHKAVDWLGNPEGDSWREYVRSLAKK